MKGRGNDETLLALNETAKIKADSLQARRAKLVAFKKANPEATVTQLSSIFRIGKSSVTRFLKEDL